jgi:hypothetical protein
MSYTQNLLCVMMIFAKVCDLYYDLYVTFTIQMKYEDKQHNKSMHQNVKHVLAL